MENKEKQRGFSRQTCMLKAVITRVGTPLDSTAAWKFIAFITVASILRQEKKNGEGTEGVFSTHRTGPGGAGRVSSENKRGSVTEKVKHKGAFATPLESSNARAWNENRGRTSKHSPHVISRCAVKTFPLVLSAAKKVATPHHHSHLHARHGSLSHLARNPLHHVRVNSKPILPSQSFPADFQHHPRPLLRTPGTNPAQLRQRDREEGEKMTICVWRCTEKESQRGFVVRRLETHNTRRAN